MLSSDVAGVLQEAGDAQGPAPDPKSKRVTIQNSKL